MEHSCLARDSYYWWKEVHRWPAKLHWEWLLSSGKRQVSSGMSVSGPKVLAIGCGRVQAIYQNNIFHQSDAVRYVALLHIQSTDKYLSNALNIK